VKRTVSVMESRVMESTKRHRWPRATTGNSRIAVLALALAVTVGMAGGQGSAEVEMHLKAAFIYNFARFIEWPGSAPAGPVRIGVLGRGNLAAPLREVIHGKSANGHPVEVATIASVADADRVQILLIQNSESKHVREIVQALAGKPVLTICENGNGIRDGAMIAFLVVDESVRFQISQKAAEQVGLKISSQLLKVALPAPEKPR
jgi:uncharacterized protein DUF4154